MASIITATTTSGLTQSADNSGVLQLASGTGNLVTVPAVTGTAMVSGNMPAFSAFPSSGQTVATGTWTKVLFQNEVFDTNNNFASSRFTPTVAGYYQMNGLVYFSTMTSSWGTIQFYKNGLPYSYGSDLNGTTNGMHLFISNLVYLNGSTDYIELYVYQGSGVNRDTGNAFVDNNFSGSMVRGA
jgi:hypothetical protein